jgi:hypothetical protein
MAAPNLSAYERIGELLHRAGLITSDQLAKALQEQKQNGTRVGYNLVKLGFIQEVELTKMLAKQHKMPAVDLSRFALDPKIAKMIPPDVARKQLVERTVLDRDVGVPGEKLRAALAAVVPILRSEKLVPAGSDPQKALSELLAPGPAQEARR